jgi:hypothetical protein
MPSPARPRSKARPNLSRQVRLLIRDIARRVPELAHVRADRVLVVAGEARRASRATIRPLRFPGGLARKPGSELRKPRVRFRGRKILYVITLRPLFFRASTAEQRIETVIHELFHTAAEFDGSLDPARRHQALKGSAFESSLRPLVKRYLAKCSAKSIARVSMNGEVLVRQWLERPPTSYRPGVRVRRRYDESQTFLGPVRMITRQTRH